MARTSATSSLLWRGLVRRPRPVRGCLGEEEEEVVEEEEGEKEEEDEASGESGER